MYQINEKISVSEALPGTAAIHNYHAQSYSLPCGDVYVVTSAGNIVFIDRDSESKVCVWNSVEQALWPCYYRPVTGHLGRSEVSTGSGGVSFIPIYCVETYKIAHPTVCPSAVSEDCVVFMLSDFDRVTEGSNQCVVFRRGVAIYKGCCDFRGTPYITTRGNSKMGNYYQARGEQVYQWAKDKDGKYLGAGLDRSKTWEWVNLISRNVNANIWNNESCAEYSVSDLKDTSAIMPQYLEGCLDCSEGGEEGEEYACNKQTIDSDRGEFVKHSIDNIWFYDCGIPSGAQGCHCLDTKLYGGERIKQNWTYGAQIVDLGGGFALLPIRHGISRFKEYTWIDTISDVSQLPGYTGSLNHLDQNALMSYQIILKDNQSLTHNGINPVIRTGIQYNDCFIIGDDFYRYEYNGWKFYNDYKKYQHRRHKWALITPDMTGKNSAMNGCDPVKIIYGADANRCGDFIVVNTVSNIGDVNNPGYYYVINAVTGASIEGSGNASISCLACFLVVRVGSTYTIYGEYLTSLWSVTANEGDNIRLTGYKRKDDLPPDTYYYARINYWNNTGKYTTFLCCTGNIITIKASTETYPGQQVTIDILQQRFAGAHNIENKHVVVVEGCSVVYDDVGILQNGIGGVQNGLVRTGKYVETQILNVGTLYVFVWIDLVLGLTGEWAGLAKSTAVTGGNDNPNNYTPFILNSSMCGLPQSLGSQWTITRYNTPYLPIDLDGVQYIGMVYSVPKKPYYDYTYFTGVSNIEYEIEADGYVIAVSGNTVRQLHKFDSSIRSTMSIYGTPPESVEKGESKRGVLLWDNLHTSISVCYNNMPEGVAGVWCSQWAIIPNPYFEQGESIDSFTIPLTTVLRGYPAPVGYPTYVGTYNVPFFLDAAETVVRYTYCSEYAYASPKTRPDLFKPGVMSGTIAPRFSYIDSSSSDYGTDVYSAPHWGYNYQEQYAKYLTIYKDGTVKEDFDASGANNPQTGFISIDRQQMGQEPTDDPCSLVEPYILKAEPVKSCDSGLRCKGFTISTTSSNKIVSWNGTDLLTVSLSTNVRFLSCCSTSEKPVSPGNIDHAWIIAGNAIYLYANAELIDSWTKTDEQTFAGSVGCSCGLVIISGKLSNGTVLVPSDYYLPGSLTKLRSIIGMDDDQPLYVRCCEGYGVVLAGTQPTPDIIRGTMVYSPAVTADNYQDLLNDERCTIAVLDDGTKAIGKWGYYTTYDCDGSNPQDHYFIQNWTFVGSDNNIRTVTNTYGGNPGSLVNGAAQWVPFRWINSTRNAAVYSIDKDGVFSGLVVQDKDIQNMRCNFFDSEAKRYLGADVTVENGSLEDGFYQSYVYPPDENVLCVENAVQNRCDIVKSINNYRLIDGGSVDGKDGFMRYGTVQLFDSAPKISQKGLLTNTKLIGKYEILNNANTTGTYSDISSLEQETRKEGSYPLMVNDREHIAKFDRIRELSQNYYSNHGVVLDLAVPGQDQTRSVFSQNGTVMILDKDLGLITVDQWGN